MSTGDAKIDTLVQQWLKWDKDPATRAEINALVEKKDVAVLGKRLLKRIAFGTAGLRGPMQAGFSCMNNLTVQQASQGLAVAVLELVPNATSMPVCIGYDGRHHSKEFATIAAKVFAGKGFKRVLLYSKVVPTPFVPFCVSQLGCCVGIMVTASHNPKQDNGYKVYWANGCQIVSPTDEVIAKRIEENLEPMDLPAEGSFEDPLENIMARYLNAARSSLSYTRSANPSHSLKIAYTAMHGVGAEYVRRIFHEFSLPSYIPVVQQLNPDPDFPTVAFPNPEEGRGALKLAMETADAAGADLILATDPDADRLAAAERQKGPDGKSTWRLFNGNELGVLLGHWCLVNYRAAHPTVDPKKCVLISTAVSSTMLQAIAKAEGMIFEQTLTGFKWIGNAAAAHMAQGRKVVAAYEEAIGFMLGEMSLDKDGVRAAAVFAEMAGTLYSQGLTCSQYLSSLHDIYGFFAPSTKYFFCYDPVVLDRIFTRLRGQAPYTRASYPQTIGRWRVERVRDVTVGFDSGNADGKSTLPVTPGTQMITYFFENGCVATLRGSGTEPKLKYYVEHRGPASDKEAVLKEQAEMTAALVEECLQPTVNGLTPPSD